MIIMDSQPAKYYWPGNVVQGIYRTRLIRHIRSPISNKAGPGGSIIHRNAFGTTSPSNKARVIKKVHPDNHKRFSNKVANY